METALYLLPVTLGDTSIEKVLPSYNKEIISGIQYFIVEDVRSARRFLKKVDREIDIDALTFYPLNKHTSPDDISGYLQPLVGGASMGVISEAGCPAVAVTGWLLGYFGFQANVVQNDQAINGIRMFLSFLPAIGTLLSILFISMYPLSERRMKEIIGELEQKRNQH